MKRKSTLKYYLILLLCVVLLSLTGRIAEKTKTFLFNFFKAPLSLFTNITYFLVHNNDYRQIIRENKKLNEEMAKLRLENWQLNHLRTENQKLRSLLEFKKHIPYSTITGEVIGFDYSENRKIIFVSLGEKEGVHKEMVCVDSEGLVGKVIEVGDHISKIMCINDPFSRVPAMTEDTYEAGLVYGTIKGEELQMRFIPSSSTIKIGTRVITSGAGIIYPKGIPIGEISGIVNSEFYKTAIIKPAVDFSKLNTVLLIKQK